MKQCGKVPVVTYSTTSRTADVFSRGVRYSAFETELEACSPWLWEAGPQNRQSGRMLTAVCLSACQLGMLSMLCPPLR